MVDLQAGSMSTDPGSGSKIVATTINARAFNLEVVNPPVWETFLDRLPRNPMATDDFTSGVWRRPRCEAVQKNYIEINPVGRLNCLAFDIDYDDSFECWENAKVPAPNVFVQNRNNGRAHLGYFLHTPVGVAGMSSAAPIKFAADIQHGMTKRLGADRGYINRFIKNPLNPKWRSSWMAVYPYELNELRGFLSDEDVWRPHKAELVGGLGRNCDLFDRVRKWAYGDVRKFKSSRQTADQWLAAVVHVATQCNMDFAPPLDTAEVQGVAKSIARYTWAKFSDEEFRVSQAIKGRRGAEVRWEGHESLAYRKPWGAAGISRATYYRLKKAER